MKNLNTNNVADFLLSNNMDSAKQVGLRVIGQAILDNVFSKVTDSLDDTVKGLVDNPATRIGFVNGAVVLASKYGVPENGMIAAALAASAWSDLGDAAADYMTDLGVFFKGVCLDGVQPAHVENQALAVVAGVKAGNDLDVVFNESKGGVREVLLDREKLDSATEKPTAKPSNTLVKVLSKPTDPKPTAVNTPPVVVAKNDDKYMPKSEADLHKGSGKKMFTCPCCNTDRKKDKFGLFSGTDTGHGDEFKGILICADCKTKFNQASKKDKDALAAEKEATERFEKASARIVVVQKEMLDLEPKINEANAEIAAVSELKVSEAIKAATMKATEDAHTDLFAQYAKLETELKELTKTVALPTGKPGAAADAIANLAG